MKRYARKARTYRRRPVGGGRRRAIKRWAGEKPSIVDKIARYAGPIGKIAKTVGGIMQMINPEKKFVDNNTAVTYVSSAGTALATYTMMPQGLGDQARNGNIVKGHSIYGRYQVVMNSTANQETTIRLLWVLDKECNGSVPPLSDILDTVDIVSGLNLDNSKRYAILKDKLITLNSGGRQSMNGKFYFPTDFHIHYDGATAAITDAKENQVFLYAVSNKATDTPYVLHFGRFKYYDN